MKYMLKFISLIFFIIMFPIVSDKFNEWFLHNKWNHSDWATFLAGLLGFCSSFIALYGIKWQVIRNEKEKVYERKEEEKKYFSIFLDSIKYEIYNIVTILKSMEEYAPLETNETYLSEEDLCKKYSDSTKLFDMYVPKYNFNETFFLEILKKLPFDFLQTANLYVYDLIALHVDIQKFFKTPPISKEVIHIDLYPIQNLLDKINDIDTSNKNIEEIIKILSEYIDTYHAEHKELKENFEKKLKNKK